MKASLIESIQKFNNTLQGRESLYYALEAEEQKCWDEIINLQVANWIEIFQERAHKHPEKIVITETQTSDSFSYKELDLASEKVADFLLSHTDEHYIGLNFPNSFLFMAALIGINKAGRTAILFNNREPEERLADLAEKNNIHIVLGNAIEGAQHFSIEEALEKKHLEKQFPIHPTTLEDPAFVIFTSGTSGPSKPALFSHRRMIGAGIAWSLRTAMDESNTCYIPLPLYHGNALAVAFSSVMYASAKAVIRPKFSVSNFWQDINDHKCSHMIYIGELWRYLVTSESAPQNPNKYLKVIFGNGLTKPLWEEVVKRYKIAHVVEHFGATEMPSGALTNWMDIPGYCGFIPPSIDTSKEMMLVDEDFKEVDFEENGEALFLVQSGVYRGYLDPSLDAPKLTRDVREKGDLWWRSGDLLKRNQEGFYTFIERLGDSYRFKGENVACADVEEAIREAGDFQEIVVYGITLPHVDGKIGMASLVPKNNFKIDTLYEKLQSKLASYALPYVIKIRPDKHQTTSTLKIQKNILSLEGIKNYDDSNYYILIEDKYTPLDKKRYHEIEEGKLILGKGSRS